MFFGRTLHYDSDTNISLNAVYSCQVLFLFVTNLANPTARIYIDRKISINLYIINWFANLITPRHNVYFRIHVIKFGILYFSNVHYIAHKSLFSTNQITQIVLNYHYSYHYFHVKVIIQFSLPKSQILIIPSSCTTKRLVQKIWLLQGS